MFKLMLLKLPARFCSLVERLGTSRDRNITQTKEVTPIPEEVFLILDHFLPSYPTDNQENANFEKMKV